MLCGKWTKRPNKMDRPSVEITTGIPEEVQLEYCDVHLDVDMMYVNGIGFLTVILQDLRLMHCQYLWQHKGENILEALYNIIDECADRDIVVVSMYGDCEFNPLKNLLKKEKKAVLETCDTDSHVHAATQINRFVKEQV